MRSIAHVWLISNSATIQLVNTPLFIAYVFLSKHHTKRRKARKHVTRMRYVSVCAPVDWRRTTERHTRNIILTWYKRYNVKTRVILI
jgi:hypothetical protein